MNDQLTLFERKEMQPLAARMRPQTVDEIVGQQHLLGKGKILRRILRSLPALPDSDSGSVRNLQIRKYRLRHIRNPELPSGRMRIPVLFPVLFSGSADTDEVYLL